MRNLIPFTPAKYQNMIDERAKCLVEREALMGRLKIAREMGDLSENGAYRYAKFELGNVGRKLRELNYLIENGEARDVGAQSAIGFGVTVTLKSSDGELKFMLVSEYEADPIKGKLSMKSPIGMAVLGKKVGENITVELPLGTKSYTVKSIA